MSQKEINFLYSRGSERSIVVEDDLGARDYYELIEKNVRSRIPLEMVDYRGAHHYFDTTEVISFYARQSLVRYGTSRVD